MTTLHEEKTTKIQNGVKRQQVDLNLCILAIATLKIIRTLLA